MVNHALALYSALIESNSLTAKFVQCLSLLEFLASPEEYENFKKVKKTIARYVAQDSREYEQLLERFKGLTGNKVGDTEKGYRTRIVHMGQRLESIAPIISEREALFGELERYIRAVVNHMIKHSDKCWREYEVIRDALRPLEDKEGQERPDVDKTPPEGDVPF